MDEHTRSNLRYLAANLVLVVGLLHIGVGILNWLRWLQGGFLLPRDARWPLFVVSGIGLIAGLYLAGRAADRRPYYAVGVVAMLGYAVGYFAWHLGGHRPYLLFGPGAATETVSVQWFLDHLFAGPVEAVAVFAEVLAAVVLSLLLLTDRG